MEKKETKRDDHSEKGNPDLASYEIIDSPLLESLKNVFSLLEPAKQELERARRASLSTSSKQPTHSQTLDGEELRLALGRAEQEIRALKNQSCNYYTDNKSDNSEHSLKERIKSFESRITDLQNENEKLKCNITEEKAAYQDVIKRQEEMITGMKAKHSTVEKTFKKMQDTISRLSKEKERDVAALQKELSETKTRLSKLMGDKLSNKNPDIADLSDKNRPTKIAERFSELYDNQWTDAFEAAERLFKGQKEEYRIKVLLQLLMNVNKFCLEEFSGQEKNFEKMLSRTSKPQTGIPAAILKELKDYWKSTAEECIPELVEKYLQNETKSKMKKLAIDAKEFTSGCVSVCWLMAHQDPQVALHSNVQRMEIVDGNFYKAYTQSGKRVDYIVWPALLLYKDGPILAKGVVQYIKPDEKKTESTNDLSKNPVPNSTKTENEKTKTIQSQQGNKSPLTTNFMSQSVRQKSSSSLKDKTEDFSKTVVGSTVTGIDIKDILAEFEEVGQIGDTMEMGGRQTVSEQIQQQNQQQNQQQQQQQHQHHRQQLPLSTCQQNLSGAQQHQQQQHQQQQPQQQYFQHVDARNNSSATCNQQQNQYHPQQNAQTGSQLMTGGFPQNITNRAASSGVQNQTMSYYQQPSMPPTEYEISCLSKVVGEKVSDNNPDIADLSDNNRPTKIAERYQELYDNQWTDAFETIVKHYTQIGETNPEQHAIERLRKILLKSFKICVDEFENQNKEILHLFLGKSENGTDLSQILKVEIKLARRKCAPDAANMIAEKNITSINENCKEGNVILMVEDFVRDCIAVCWLMVLQDPQVVLHTQNIEIFDGSLYKEYTVRGKKIHFIVWPALLLHKGGPTLSKGIAQCVKELKDNSSTNKDGEKHKQKIQSNKVSKPEASEEDKSLPDKKGGEMDEESVVNNLHAEKKENKLKQTHTVSNSASDRDNKCSSAESSVPSIDEIRFKSKRPNTGGAADAGEWQPEKHN